MNRFLILIALLQCLTSLPSASCGQDSGALPTQLGTGPTPEEPRRLRIKPFSDSIFKRLPSAQPGFSESGVRPASFEGDTDEIDFFEVESGQPKLQSDREKSVVEHAAGNELQEDQIIAPLEDPVLGQGDQPLIRLGDWLDQVRVGYDNGFQIISRDELDLNGQDDKFRLKINGWGQLRNTLLESANSGEDLRQFQLKRGRLVFAGSAFTPDFGYFVQVDGRSSDGDDLRLLDYYLNYDFGRHFLNMEKGRLSFRTGRWKMPTTLSRWLSGRELEFSDRSVASMFFDVNRSLAWGLGGQETFRSMPFNWELAIFNGLVTGGAETGSSGDLDSNFAYSIRAFCEPIGEWGKGELADLDYHEALAMRTGFGMATSTIDRTGLTEFRSARVVDSGRRLSDLLPNSVESYRIYLYSADLSVKYRGWSITNEYYFRTVDRILGAEIGQLFDHGHWLQIGKFIIPDRLQVIARWSRVDGNSGTLGIADLSSDEVAGGVVYYFRDQHAKITFDATRINGSPISSAALDLEPGVDGLLFRTQIQFSF